MGCINRRREAASRGGSFTVCVQLLKFTCKMSVCGGWHFDIMLVQFTLPARTHTCKHTGKEHMKEKGGA